MQYIMIRYLVDSIENMRDIGGYLVGDNKRIQYQKIIRSNLPNCITQNDIEYLKKIGIRTVIDLRSQEEIKNKKSVFENNKDFKLLHYKINGDGKVPNTCKDVPISYMKMLDGTNTIHNIFKVLVKNEQGILYFCNAGKDRTGVVTALILMTLGIKRQDIVENYTLSSLYLKNKLKEFEKNSTNKKIREIITPKPEYMEQFLDCFYEKYTTINNYLIKIGITNEDITKIKDKYLENI